MTLIFDLAFQFMSSYGHKPYTHIRNSLMSVGSKDRVETNGQTDATACFTFSSNAVDNNVHANELIN